MLPLQQRPLREYNNNQSSSINQSINQHSFDLIFLAVNKEVSAVVPFIPPPPLFFLPPTPLA